ncbi:Threonine/homoserine efflux transporter RhtA [Aeromonas sp. RU39B]|uniref:DMT family transporter n=1 Tax=Aeromonas sp. RU39B TaxID=1907416 RepID=UPI000954DCC9|nr:DMT family transporter [Aeromonas sp. RU39B]SIQ24953.1 Threonine/homoserine efflux transporter RhtA [Aeromonas sp. RU39B]
MQGRQSTQKADWLAWVMLALPPLFWAGNFIVGRAMRDTVPPMALSFYRWLIALVCLLPFVWPAFKRDARHYWRVRWTLLGVSLTGVAAFNVLVYIGLQSTSAANGMLLNSFIPLLIAALGALLYRERLTLGQWSGMLLSLCGVIIIVSHGSWQTLVSLSVARGDLIVFIATVCWAFYTLWLRQIPVAIDRRGLMLAQILIGLVALLPLYVWEWLQGNVAAWNMHSLLAVGYVGIFPSVVAFMLYGAGVMRVGAARAGLFIHLIPLFGALLSVVVLREALHLYQLVGMLAILSGVVWVNRKAGH